MPHLASNRHSVRYHRPVFLLIAILFPAAYRTDLKTAKFFTQTFCPAHRTRIFFLHGKDYYEQNSSNKLIDAGQELSIMIVGVVGFEADLDAPFEVNVKLLNSSDETETFTFSVE